jgi:hypothetical protein
MDGATKDKISDEIDPTIKENDKENDKSHKIGPLESIAVSLCFAIISNMITLETDEHIQKYYACGDDLKTLCLTLLYDTLDYMQQYDWSQVYHPIDSFTRMARCILEKIKTKIAKEYTKRHMATKSMSTLSNCNL